MRLLPQCIQVALEICRSGIWGIQLGKRWRDEKCVGSQIGESLESQFRKEKAERLYIVKFYFKIHKNNLNLK